MIFGQAVRIKHVPGANASQINAFFGVSGTQSVMGGSRGRTFMVQGVFVDSSVAGIRAQEALLLSYADGLARVLTDTYGTAWPAVIFEGQYQPEQLAFVPGGFALPYKATFRGLV